MILASWFFLGWLAGITTLAIAAIITINYENNKTTNEEFVKTLVKQKGWTDARWELETAFKGKYMRIWRRLYKKQIEKGEENNEQ